MGFGSLGLLNPKADTLNRPASSCSRSRRAYGQRNWFKATEVFFEWFKNPSAARCRSESFQSLCRRCPELLPECLGLCVWVLVRSVKGLGYKGGSRKPHKSYKQSYTPTPKSKLHRCKPDKPLTQRVQVIVINNYCLGAKSRHYNL